MRCNFTKFRLLATSAIVAATSLYLASSLAAPPASAQAYYHGDGVCRMYCDGDSGGGGGGRDYDENSAPARLGRAINRAVRDTFNGLFSGLAAIVQPPKRQDNAFFGTGGTPSQPGVDLTPPSPSQTPYDSVGAQAYAAQEQPGCVFDGRGGCPTGSAIDYKVGIIGSISFKYPVISREVYAKMSATDKRKLNQLIKDRYGAETDLPRAQRAYAEAQANAAGQAEMSNLQNRIRADKNTIDGSNKEIEKLIDRVVLD